MGQNLHANMEGIHRDSQHLSWHYIGWLVLSHYIIHEKFEACALRFQITLEIYYCIGQNFDSGKVWRNLMNEARQKVWQAKLWRIELGFVRAGKNKLLWNYNVLTRVENL